MRRIGAALGALAALGASIACAPRRVTQLPDPAGAHRFEIVSIGDSTFAFLAVGAPWVRGGFAGISVDPQRRDALVARFVVQGRAGDTVTALVTGQTGHLASTYVALLDPPKPRMLGQRGFWIGLFTGGVLGVAGVVTAVRER